MPNDNITESWLCVDCGVNTAPGIPDGSTMRAYLNSTGSAATHINTSSEVYMVRAAVWTNAGMEPFGGCLCIGCLEKRLGRKLRPKDFDRSHEFNRLPGALRLFDRRGNKF
jgi:hypothetical protein